MSSTSTAPSSPMAEAVVLLERSARAGRANKYQALIAAELQRQRESESKALRVGEKPADSDEDDVDFVLPVDDAVEEQDLNDEAADYSDDAGDLPYEDEVDAEEQLLREERAARRNKDSSLSYLKKRRRTTRKPLRSTFDIDPVVEPPTDPSAADEDEADTESVDILQVGRRRPLRHSPVASTSAAAAATRPEMLVRRRAPRNVKSTYRHVGASTGPASPTVSVQKRAPKPKNVAAPTRLTQEERMEDALQMEEENQDALRTWLADEEQKRRDRRPLPKVIHGPRLTFVSAEESRPITLAGGGKDDVAESEGEPGRKSKKKRGTSTPSASPERPLHDMLRMSDEEGSTSEPPSPAREPSTGGKARAVAGETELMDGVEEGACAQMLAVSGDPSAARSSRTYLHLSHPPSTQRQEMAILFGDHVDWGQAPPQPVEREYCVITGLPARYKDPKTGKPYATVEAYAEIKRLYHGERQPKSALKSAATAGSSSKRSQRTVRINDDDSSEIELLEGPPSPVKSVGGRSHRSNSTGDELVMESWA